MQIEAGKTYLTKNGDVVQVKKNNLPYYCFSAQNLNEQTKHLESEVWNENGTAYHDDCGYNFIREVSQSEI